MAGRYDTGGGEHLARDPVELQVLGSSGAAEPGRGSTAFLLRGIRGGQDGGKRSGARDLWAVDAGSLASGLPLAEQARVETLLLTHRHFDHVRELPLFLDNVMARGVPPVRVLAERATLRSLFRHLFNGELWPDVRRFPRPPAEFAAIREGISFRRGEIGITPIRTRHTAPTVGFVFHRGSAASVLLGDTGPSEALSRRLAALPRLEALVIEVSYPSRLEDLARRTLHLTPPLLAEALAPIRRAHPRLRVLVTHLKPPWRAETERELRRLDPPVTILEDGERHRFLG